MVKPLIVLTPDKDEIIKKYYGISLPPQRVSRLKSLADATINAIFILCPYAFRILSSTSNAEKKYGVS